MNMVEVKVFKLCIKKKIIVNPIMLDKPNFYIIDKDVLMYSGIFYN